MKHIALQSSVVYGPLESRRFGRSLGINLLPANRRICTFDCVYCQYHDEGAGGGSGFASLSDLDARLMADFDRVRDASTPIDWIMLSGNGEPTLHPHFAAVVDRLLELRDSRFPGTPVGILSNSSTCHKKEVAGALARLDGRFMKLDAGSLYIFHDVNRPRSTLSWGEVIEGLCGLLDVTLQSMFITGRADNTGDRAVDDWIEAVRCIRPVEVQVYTIERAPQERGTLPAGAGRLEEISSRLRERTGIRSVAYC